MLFSRSTIIPRARISSAIKSEDFEIKLVMSNNKSQRLSRKAGGYTIYRVGNRNPAGLTTEKENSPHPGIPNDHVRLVFRAAINLFKLSLSEVSTSKNVTQLILEVFAIAEHDPAKLEKYGSKSEVVHLREWISLQKTVPLKQRNEFPLSDSQYADIEKRIDSLRN